MNEETIAYFTKLLTGMSLTVNKIKEFVEELVGIPFESEKSCFEKPFLLTSSSKTYNDLKSIESFLSGFLEAKRMVKNIENNKNKNLRKKDELTKDFENNKVNKVNNVILNEEKQCVKTKLSTKFQTEYDNEPENKERENYFSCYKEKEQEIKYYCEKKCPLKKIQSLVNFNKSSSLKIVNSNNILVKKLKNLKECLRGEEIKNQDQND